MSFTIAKSVLCDGASCRRQLAASLLPLQFARKRHSAPTVQNGRAPLRMAVVGSGPAGFYTAYRVMSKVESKVDMYEALPVPFGLVRFGVAPDHPEVKNCQSKFEEVAESKNFTFVGNVAVGSGSGHDQGSSVPLPTLLRHYDAVVFAYGASKDKILGVPGESLKGIYSARQFVGWYNGLPEHANLAPDLRLGDEAVIVGQGNVALDVARMLLENVDVLRKTDIADYALATLAQSRVKRVHVVGRRGPMQAAFTIKEVRELMMLPGVGLHAFDKSLIPQNLKELPRASRRLMEVLSKGSATPLESASKSWSLDFCLSPKQFIPVSQDAARVGATTVERTSLVSAFDPRSHTQATGEAIDIPSEIVFRSIGYKSEPLAGFSELDIPFDERKGIIVNDGIGRVVRDVRTQSAAMAQEHFPGLYCSGWVKRGPTGVIASTMEDAFATGDAIAQDWDMKASFLANTQDPGEKHGWQGVLSELGTIRARVVSWTDWQAIDKAEADDGARMGKGRNKFTRVADMLSIV